MQWGGGKPTTIPELLPEETRESPSKRFLRTGFRSTSAKKGSSCSCLEAGSETRAFSPSSFSHYGPVGAPRRKSHLCSSENKQTTLSKINPSPIQPTKHPENALHICICVIGTSRTGRALPARWALGGDPGLQDTQALDPTWKTRGKDSFRLLAAQRNTKSPPSLPQETLEPIWRNKSAAPHFSHKLKISSAVLTWSIC